jgi:hypothetical protein
MGSDYEDESRGQQLQIQHQAEKAAQAAQDALQQKSDQAAQAARDAAVDQARQSEATRVSNNADAGELEKAAVERDRIQRQAQDDMQHSNEENVITGRAAQRQQESQKASEDAIKAAEEARKAEKSSMDAAAAERKKSEELAGKP